MLTAIKINNEIPKSTQIIGLEKLNDLLTKSNILFYPTVSKSRGC